MKSLFRVLPLLALLLASLPTQDMVGAQPPPKEVKPPAVDDLEEALRSFPSLYSMREELKQKPEFKQEREKFKVYKLNNKENAIKFLRKIFFKPRPKGLPNYNSDLWYLRELDYLSRVLWYQHSLMQNFLDLLCFYTCDNEIKKIGDRWAHDGNNFHILLSNYNSISIFYYYGSLLMNSPSGFNEEIKKIIDDLDASHDPEISQLACILYIRIENNFINPRIVDLKNNFKFLTDHIDNIMHNINFHENVAPSNLSETTAIGFVKSNKKYLDEIYTLLSPLKNNHQELIKALTTCILRYTLTHSFYEQLYQLVREEVQSTVKKCVADKNNVTECLNYLKNPYNKSHFSPTLIPLTLAPDTFKLAKIHSDLLNLKCLKKSDAKPLLGLTTVEKPSKEPAPQPEVKPEIKVEETKADIFHKQPEQPQIKEKKPKSQAKVKKEPIAVLEKMAEEQECVARKSQEELEAEPITPLRLLEPMVPEPIQVKPKAQPKKTAIATDESYILQGEETPATITIHDPKNQMKIILFKRREESKIEDKINYKKNVKEWFDDWKGALSKKVAPEKLNLNDPEQRKILAIHRFSKLVDEYIGRYGTKCTTSTGKGEHAGKQETAIIIPGTIIYDDGREEYGLFSYLIDEEGNCFHRMFEVRTHTEFIKQISSKGCLGYYEK